MSNTSGSLLARSDGKEGVKLLVDQMSFALQTCWDVFEALV